MPHEDIEKRLECAAKRIHASIPPAGASAGAAQKILTIGLARFHWAQERFGFDPDASFISSAVLSLPKNKAALDAGFAYGGLLQWTGEIVPTKIKSTGCGYLAAGLMKAPERTALEKSIRAAEVRPIEPDGVRLNWDLDRGNHFLNIYRVTEPGRIGGWPYLAVLHSSGGEFRYDGPSGPGAYVHHSEYWKPHVIKCETPWGRLAVLTEGAAIEYAARCGEILGFCAKRRKALIKAVLPEAEVLFNTAHHGYVRPGEFALGCHSAPTADGPAWHPFMTGKNRPAYLIEPIAGFEGVLPHGAGPEAGPGVDIPELLEKKGAAGIVTRLDPLL